MNNLARLSLIIALPIILAGCVTGRVAQPSTTLETARNQLTAANMPAPASPFSTRNFTPNMTVSPLNTGIDYGPYRRGQAPWGPEPLSAQLQEDLHIMARYWHYVRIYNADSLAARMLGIMATDNLPLKVILGVWLENEAGKPDIRIGNINNTLKAIELANRYPQLVTAVCVGNETQVSWSAHQMPANDLIRYIRVLRARVSQPVATADDYSYWDKPESMPVAAEVDFIITHMHPLWNSRTLDNTFDWLTDTMAAVTACHPQKTVVLGETGWATRYNPQKIGPGEQGTLVRGEVSEAGQEQFLTGLHAWVAVNHVPTFLFEAFDEPWKGGSAEADAGDIEKNWGVFDADRQPKQSFIKYFKPKQ